MGILNELQERMHHCIIAGTNLINEDFKLLKIIEQFEKLGSSNPVFNKIYSELKNINNSDTKEKNDALINAITLVDAVVCTQASFQTEGDIQAIDYKDNSEEFNQYKYSQINPLITALTTKGSGRYEVIYNAYINKDNVLKDYRMRSHLIKALGDSYSDISEVVKLILMQEDNIIYDLKKDFDKHGKKDMLRRLEIIKEKARENENEFYLSLLEESANPIKISAINALGYSEDNIDTLIGLTKTEKGSVKETVLITLGNFNTHKVNEFWKEHLKKTKSSNLDYLKLNSSDIVSDIIAEKIDNMIDQIINNTDDIDVKEFNQSFVKFISILRNKTSDNMILLLDKLAKNLNKLSKLYNKSENNKLFSNTFGSNLDIIENEIYYTMLFNSNNVRYIDECKNLYKKYNNNQNVFLKFALLGELLINPYDAYDKFEDTYTSKKTLDVIEYIFSSLYYSNSQEKYYLTEKPYYLSKDKRVYLEYFDKRFIKVCLICLKDAKLDDIINEKDNDSLELLRCHFLKEIKKSPGVFYINELKRCKNKDWSGMLVDYIKACSNSFTLYRMRNFYHFAKNLPLSNEEMISEMEAAVSFFETNIIKVRYSTKEDILNQLRITIENLKQNRGLDTMNTIYTW